MRPPTLTGGLALLAIVRARPTKLSTRAALNFGTCPTPVIAFGENDNRKETSFAPANRVQYNHGSADAIKIITQFVCDNLVNHCGLSNANSDDAAALEACSEAQTAAAGVANQKSGLAADVFNKALGVDTHFATVAVIDDQGTTLTAGSPPQVNAGATIAAAFDLGAGRATAATATTPPGTTAVATVAPPAADTTAAQTAAAAPTAAAAAGANLQTFTGELGGSLPPAVSKGGRGFVVAGNADFVNLAAALQRSCDEQHNLCANAANASHNQGELTVAACGSQQSECNGAGHA